MFRTIKLKLPYDSSLVETGKQFMKACQIVLDYGFAEKTYNKNKLNRGTYRDVREKILKGSDYGKLASKVQKLVNALESIMQTLNINGAINSIGSMYQVFFGLNHARNYHEVMKADRSLFKQYFNRMLNAGIYLPPSTFETNFMSFAHSDEDIESTILKMEESLKNARDNLRNKAK